MGNRKTKPLEMGMRVDSTADLQENSGDLIVPPNSVDASGNGTSSAPCCSDDGGKRLGLASKSPDATTTLYKAVNLDENGKFIQFGFLEVTGSEIVFHRVPHDETDILTIKSSKKQKERQKAAAQLSVSTSSDPTASRALLGKSLSRTEAGSSTASIPPIRWPFHLLRRYGYDQDLFTIETGRRACTGAGIYAFHTNNAAELFRDLQEAIRQSSANLRKKRELSGARTTRRRSSTEAAEGRSAFKENSAGDFMHWSPVLVGNDQTVRSASASVSALAVSPTRIGAGNTAGQQPLVVTLKENSMSPPLPSSQLHAPSSAIGRTSPHYMEPPKQPDHNYVNLLDKFDSSVNTRSKREITPAPLSPSILADGEDAHEYKTLSGEPRIAVQARAADAHAEERQYENLSHVEDSRNSDAFYVNLSQASRGTTQQRDANGHLPGCPCHRKSVNSKAKGRDALAAASANTSANANSIASGTQAARQLNYVELDLRNYLKQANAVANFEGCRSDCADTCTTADSEDNATSLSELTTLTKITAVTNASSYIAASVASSNANGAGTGTGTGSSSPSATSSSVFSANGKLAQASNSFLALSESRQPLLGSGSIGSASGVCATLALAKSGNQSRPNSDSLTQTHVCAMHKHVMKCKEHPLVKQSGSQRMIQYTQIDFERTTALTNSKKSLEGPRSSVSKDPPSSKKNSADTLMANNSGSRKEKQNGDELSLRSNTVSRASPPKTQTNTLVTDLLKRSRHNSNN